MPNSLDSNGLTIKTLAEVTADLTTAMQNIYGADINVESNSPDGQMINIFAQAVIDNLEVLVDVYNVMDPELSFGVNQNKVFALNGLTRNPSTFTTTPVSITTNKALTLTGRDALLTNPNAQVFSVQDANKNVFELITTYAFGAAGTTSLSFQAVTPGALEVLPNTITQQATPILGVTVVNNPSVSTTVVGVDEETDVAFKIRRAKMFLLASTGPADAVQAALLAPYTQSGVTYQAADAMVVENDTSGTVNGVPARSIYCIVRNNGSAGHRYQIPRQIISKKIPGCGLHGSESETITRNNSLPFIGKWDWAVAQPLYMTFGITPKTPGITFDNAVVAAELAAALEYFLGQTATIGEIVVAMNTLFPNAIVTGAGVSATAGSYTDTVAPSALKNYWTVDAANIAIT